MDLAGRNESGHCGAAERFEACLLQMGRNRHETGIAVLYLAITLAKNNCSRDWH